jgi:lipoate-protein ligase A
MPRMIYVDRTFPTPEENLACDEAFLDEAEEGCSEEILRFWEPVSPFAVLGYSNRVDQEVNTAFCSASGIPVLRRPSGGGTVLQGPGCLNYSLVLKIKNGPMQTLTGTNQWIMEQNRQALKMPDVQIQGTTDLTLGGLKFSGNAQRRKKDFLLFHGTFLLNFDISLIEKTLLMPSRQPAYRKKRSHREFLTNLNLPAETLKANLKTVWSASKKSSEVPENKILELVRNKYSKPEWNSKF